MARNKGFTLIEILLTAAALSMLLAVVYQVWFGIGDSARLLQSKAEASEDAVRAISRMARELRQADRGSLTRLPANNLSYAIAEDRDGNGYAVDAQGRLELSEPRRITRDHDDLNKDGLREKQLVLVADGVVTVLANGLCPEEDKNQNGVLDPNEDANQNGRLDVGLRFEAAGEAIQLTVETQRTTFKGFLLLGQARRLVLPRNNSQ
jgi:prepilin-type N-terminal cleavage/methylation domain-containing protein